MTTTTAETLAATFSILADNAKDILPGRRNFCVVCYDGKIQHTGTLKRANERGILSWYLKDMARRDVHIYNFTYKKDMEKVVNLLKEKYPIAE